MCLARRKRYVSVMISCFLHHVVSHGPATLLLLQLLFNHKRPKMTEYLSPKRKLVYVLSKYP